MLLHFDLPVHSFLLPFIFPIHSITFASQSSFIKMSKPLCYRGQKLLCIPNRFHRIPATRWRRRKAMPLPSDAPRPLTLVSPRLSLPQAFNRGKREGFFLKSVDNAPLAKRRKMKMTSTGVETRWSSSSSSSSSSTSSSASAAKPQPKEAVSPKKS